MDAIKNLITQNIFVAIALLVVGFFFLIKGADVFVEGSSNVAKRLRIPSIIIGMTIVAMGTSLPETAVSITASATNNNELAVGNAIGSNIFNLMVVIGCCCLFQIVEVSNDTLKRDLPFSIICALLLALLGGIDMKLGKIDGIILLVLLVVFIVVMIKATKKSREEGNELNGEIGTIEKTLLYSMPISITLIFVGIAGITVGGDLVVDCASSIASRLGISQTIIGLTVVALGTSLPELCTSIVAARKGEIDMALGNAIGSNIFNILMVLGLAAAISPISFLLVNVIDIFILVAFTLVVWAMVGKKHALNRVNGIVMILLYVIYIAYICIR